MSKFSLVIALAIISIVLAVRAKRVDYSDGSQGSPGSCILRIEWDASGRRLNCGIVSASIAHKIAHVSLRERDGNKLISSHNLNLSLDDDFGNSAGFYIEIGADNSPSPFTFPGDSMFSIKHDGAYCIEVFTSVGGSNDGGGRGRVQSFDFHCSYPGSDAPRIVFLMR